MNTRLCNLNNNYLFKNKQTKIHSNASKKKAGQNLTKTADTSYLMEKEKTKVHSVLVTIKKVSKCCAYRIRLGKFLTSLLWEGEVEMPTLSSLAVLSWQCPGPSPELLH